MDKWTSNAASRWPRLSVVGRSPKGPSRSRVRCLANHRAVAVPPLTGVHLEARSTVSPGYRGAASVLDCAVPPHYYFPTQATPKLFILPRLAH